MSNKQGYILRYYLPVKPNFDEEYTKKRFDELLKFCEGAKIDAVMYTKPKKKNGFLSGIFG